MPPQSSQLVPPVLAIVHSIGATVDVARQISRTVRAFNSTYKDAPQQLFFIVVRLTGLGDVLRHLRSFLFRSLIFNRHSVALIEETAFTVAVCRGRLNLLGKSLVRLFQLPGSGEKIGILGRLAWKMSGSRTVDTMLGKLLADQSKLNMMLTMFHDEEMNPMFGHGTNASLATTIHPSLTDPNTEDYEFEEVLWLSPVYKKLSQKVGRAQSDSSSSSTVGNWSLCRVSRISHSAVIKLPVLPKA